MPCIHMSGYPISGTAWQVTVAPLQRSTCRYDAWIGWSPISGNPAIDAIVLPDLGDRLWYEVNGVDEK